MVLVPCRIENTPITIVVRSVLESYNKDLKHIVIGKQSQGENICNQL
jgi:hypothetical protein